MSNEKLAEALRQILDATGGYVPNTSKVIWRNAQDALRAHAAEAAQAQAQGLPFTQKQFTDALTTSGSVRREAVDDSVNWDGGLTFDNIGSAYRALEMLVAAAPQQAAEPVAWRSVSLPSSFICDPPKNLDLDKWEPLYARPQPAQDALDAARYRWLRDMADIDKDHPYVMQRVPEPTEDCDMYVHGDYLDAAIDVAMAKESGR